MIPERTIASLDRYVNHKILPGAFLTAVLSNDLFQAVGRADRENLAALPEIVQYIYNELPGLAHGSEKAVYKFVEEKFYERLTTR